MQHRTSSPYGNQSVVIPSFWIVNFQDLSNTSNNDQDIKTKLSVKISPLLWILKTNHH